MLTKILNNWQKTLFGIATTQLAGFLSGILAGSNIKVKYLQYNLPVLSPPGWVFGIAWFILYLLIGTALGLILAAHAPKKMIKKGLWFFSAQLFLNFMWSIIFFRFELMLLSIINILALDFLAIKTMLTFKQIDKTAFYLFIPYILWLLFATYLNIAIVILN